jgi:hypothetical protein
MRLKSDSKSKNYQRCRADFLLSGGLGRQPVDHKLPCGPPADFPTSSLPITALSNKVSPSGAAGCRWPLTQLPRRSGACAHSPGLRASWYAQTAHPGWMWSRHLLLRHKTIIISFPKQLLKDRLLSPIAAGRSHSPTPDNKIITAVQKPPLSLIDSQTELCYA